MNISKIEKFITFVSIALSASISGAVEYYFDAGAFRVNHADSLLSATADYWYVKNGTSYVKNNAVPQLTSTDSVNIEYISANLGGNGGSILLESDLNVASLVMHGALAIRPAVAGAEININAKSITMSTYVNGIVGRNVSVNVSGDVILKQMGCFGGMGFTVLNTNCNDSIKSLHIGGKLELSEVDNSSYFYVTGIEGHSIDNPDAVIGELNCGTNSVGRNSNLVYGCSAKTSTINQNSYAWFGKISGSAGLGIGGNSSSTGSLTVVLTNAENSVTSGSIKNEGVSKGNISIVMRSSTVKDGGGYNYLNNSQSFTGSSLDFKGGVTMISGGLYLNYAETSGVSHGSLIFNQAAGAMASFGNANSQVGGAFLFDAIVMQRDGRIAVRMDLDDSNNFVYDALTLQTKVSGSGSLVIDMKNFNGNNPDDMIEFMIDHNLTLKVISWSALADEGILFTTDDAYKVYNFNGENYVFNATKTADGLYVNYVLSVPEASYFAAALGLLALAGAVWKKRK